MPTTWYGSCAVYLTSGPGWPLFIGRFTSEECNEIVGTFVHMIDPYGRGIILL